MCGIVGGVAQRCVTEILLEGLKRLEYRGYDSAGVALLNNQQILRERRVGKVINLAEAVAEHQLAGAIGIAHTRWATHGKPTENNAHPHMSGKVAVVHNGIIENYQELKDDLQTLGYVFTSQTDTEVVAHLVAEALKSTDSLLEAVETVVPQLKGAYALGIIHSDYPDELITVREGSPLVIGVGIGENFISSDQLALLPVTNRFMYLEEGDIARLTRTSIEVFANGERVERPVRELDATVSSASKGEYKHYMLKEIYEQPEAIKQTISQALDGNSLRDDFLKNADADFNKIQSVQIIACGTSYHSGMIAKYWFEQLIGVPCQVEIASEFRYRTPVIVENTLYICISQSGETADTLAALRETQKRAKANNIDIQTLTICNVATSSMVRETDHHLLTLAGPEIGVASTKAFTTQLAALMLLILKIGQVKQRISPALLEEITRELWHSPKVILDTLKYDPEILRLSELFVEKNHCLFLGRGTNYPIALEGALKLKEISYIHAEGYAAGELKHGPLALVDNEMPIVILAPNDEMLDKLKSNMEEVQARGGELFVFADENSGINEKERQHVVHIPAVNEWLAPIVYSVPVQLLSYHVAVLRGTDVDQPRNLAKSVTVE
ncbi:glutamine--fructose-6-phosphate aminotransferase [Acinetobacter pittii]|jgi:glucosamine--fructose-6-phosphate aminotransferase (isomerizing)|uniref:Glutamine--fructose-6-phosphate aminotransferase [isomerizing] n=2 Tax=Acinetobacter calcoaceticus/baumannii complex TaxID=909768 RepID=A0A1C2VKL0_ACIPI|nr:MULTISPECIES: glutamine--fructose-6-phosphate transaminase (isomerizing) [Acinetobacter]AUT32672.1 glutamine--fructose-6-phosphate transaminase (isomerizing) [Acinetobacter pittii]AVN16760.1 glutamine--fructose-6-phosphate transaminase (isomerizing) [Acinetobacter pittii]AVN20491.1 glutamine--fructose-6-phosphate transaminase (isomerizing) [Acinetobacter pittii]AZB91747.1 glutamine--fructose-6-phosphate transaminase (isomerizing) [Acinetobacter pittii]AZB97837.1 glutamine--fructose-6-phosph